MQPMCMSFYMVFPLTSCTRSADDCKVIVRVFTRKCEILSDICHSGAVQWKCTWPWSCAFDSPR